MDGMLENGFILMGAGMGAVALFLTALVLVMIGTSAVVQRLETPRSSRKDAKPAGTPATAKAAKAEPGG